MAPTLPFAGTPVAGKAQRRASGKASHSRSYPRGVGLDFRKLAGHTLLSYIDLHGASSKTHDGGQATNFPFYVMAHSHDRIIVISLTGVPVRVEAPPSELAVAVARHFEQLEVDEEKCIGGFLERLEKGPNAYTDYAREVGVFDGRAPSPMVLRRRRCRMAGKLLDGWLSRFDFTVAYENFLLKHVLANKWQLRSLALMKMGLGS